MNDFLDNLELEPLEPDESLFVEGGQLGEIACIDYDVSEQRYMASFQEAGNALVGHILDGGIQDLLVFPMLFAYRHWLELRLKSLIALGRRWREEPPKAQRGHRLQTLWPKARADIEAAFPGDSADLDALSAVINELAQVDPESQTFRYARNRKGSLNLADGPRNLNVAHIAAVMQKIALILDGAADGMDEMMRSRDD
jgi:hypothetical protein